ncbi:similar to THO2 [Actinidia rufa]|uniref:Similar to THO2 n=1 Tax=Actinidia rufa TaxID=165716 RepID=A0A7J0FUY1_9ERIC|nr:similar to THO2 [Actinidia rufa]
MKPSMAHFQVYFRYTFCCSLLPLKIATISAGALEMESEDHKVADSMSGIHRDLKVLATGVTAALAARKPSWITEEEFGMGYLELKPAPSLASKSLASNLVSVQKWPSSNIERDLVHSLEVRPGGTANVSSPGATTSSTLPTLVKSFTQSVKSLDIRGDDSTDVSDVQRPPSSRPVHSPRHDNSIIASKSGDKPQKRVSPTEEPDRQNKHRKGETDSRVLDGDVRFSDRERSINLRLGDKHLPVDLDKLACDETVNRLTNKHVDRSKDKGSEIHDRDYRERLERPEKSHADDTMLEKSRDRSMERHGRERYVEKGQDRATEKSHVDDRFYGQNLPPPPPLPHMVPQSVNAGRRDEDADRRFGTARHSQRLSMKRENGEDLRRKNAFVS